MEHTIRESSALGQGLATALAHSAKPWYRTSHLLKLNLMLGSVMFFGGTVGYDNSMMNGLQSLSQWQLFMNHPVGARLGFINAIQALGTFIGLLMMAPVANKYGRKRSIHVGLVILCVGVGFQTGAWNPDVFVAARFFVGLASGFFFAVPLLIAELAYPRHRGKLTAMYNCIYYFGSLVAAWAIFGSRNVGGSWAWRIPSLLQMAIPLMSITGTLLCPESPRWLVSAGRNFEARAIMIKYHAGGDVTSLLVSCEMDEVEHALRVEREISAKTGYIDMFKAKGNRHRLFISVSIGVFSQWSGCGVVSYYLSSVLASVGIESVRQQTLINGIFQLWNILVSISGAAAVDSLGRRVLLLTSSVGMLVCYVCITGLSASFAATAHAATGLAVIPALFLYYAFYDIAFTPLVVAYPAEIWPYHLRSMGVAVAGSSAFLALFFNLLVNPIALAGLGWRYYLVYVGVLVGIVVVVWLAYPETKGRSLEEMKLVFDGEDGEGGEGDREEEEAERRESSGSDKGYVESLGPFPMADRDGV